MAYQNPHLDPSRAPSGRGQHPHTLRSADEVHNPQVMYERARGMVPRPVGAAPPPAETPSLLDNPLVIFGLGALAVIAAAKLLSDKEPRKNPAPGPPQPAPSVIVVSPPGIPIQTAVSSLPPAVQSVTVEAARGDPLALAAKTLTERATVTETVKVTEKPKRKASPERVRQMKKSAAQQGRYRTGAKKGQFKPKRKKS